MNRRLPLFDLKNAVYAYMNSEDISLSELARRKGMSYSTLSNFLRCTNLDSLHIDTIFKVLKAIDKTAVEYDPGLEDLGFALIRIHTEMVQGKSYNEIGWYADMTGAELARLICKYKKTKRVSVTYGTAKKLLKILDILEGVE